MLLLDLFIGPAIDISHFHDVLLRCIIETAIRRLTDRALPRLEDTLKLRRLKDYSVPFYLYSLSASVSLSFLPWRKIPAQSIGADGNASERV